MPRIGFQVLAYLGAVVTTLLYGTELANAGPPFVSDDPEPTDYTHFEIYLFTDGANAQAGTAGSFGLDFNYGAAPNLQLTAVIPLVYDEAKGGPATFGIGNVELAAKYRVLHQSDIGWDVAVFPRVFLPAGSALVGEKHFSLLLPLWLERDFGRWSMFGGGGCVINRSGGSHDFCLASWALTRQVLPDLQLGAEVVHQTADKSGGRALTGLGLGARFDLSEHFHLLGYAGPGLQNTAQTGRLSWYSSLELTF